MAIIRAQVELPSVTALPKDSAINTFHFQTVASPASSLDLDFIEASIANFYDIGVATTGKPGSYISERISRVVPTTITLYDLADLEPRVPVREGDFTLAAALNSTELPDEVACVLSFQAVALSGINQARRRNRIYLGPLNGAALPVTAGVRSRPRLELRNALATKAAAMAVDTPGDPAWVVLSTATGVPVVADVQNGWIDDAWDTQRRRGLDATLRTLWTE